MISDRGEKKRKQIPRWSFKRTEVLSSKFTNGFVFRSAETMVTALHQVLAVDKLLGTEILLVVAGLSEDW